MQGLLFFMHWRLPGCFEIRRRWIRDKRMVLADKEIVTTLKLNVGIAFQIKKSDIQCKSKPAHLYFFQFLHLDNFIQALDIYKRMGDMESFTLIFLMASMSFWRNKISLQLPKPEDALALATTVWALQTTVDCVCWKYSTHENSFFHLFNDLSFFINMLRAITFLYLSSYIVASYPPVPLGNQLQQAIHLTHRKTLQPPTLKHKISLSEHISLILNSNWANWNDPVIKA